MIYDKFIIFVKIYWELNINKKLYCYVEIKYVYVLI